MEIHDLINEFVKDIIWKKLYSKNANMAAAWASRYWPNPESYMRLEKVLNKTEEKNCLIWYGYRCAGHSFEIIPGKWIGSVSAKYLFVQHLRSRYLKRRAYRFFYKPNDSISTLWSYCYSRNELVYSVWYRGKHYVQTVTYPDPRRRTGTSTDEKNVWKAAQTIESQLQTISSYRKEAGAKRKNDERN